MRIAVVGNINLDINAKLSESANREEERINSLIITPGGTATNTAIQLARLGNKVVLYGNIGNDIFGNHLMKELSKEGIDTSRIKRSENSNTGMCFVSLPNHGDRHLYTYRGANELDLRGEKNKITHMAGVTPFQVSNWIDGNLSEFISYVPGGIVTFEYPEEILKISSDIDVLVFNKSEYDFILKYGNPESKLTVITEGKEGARIAGEGTRANSYRVNQIDSTGAGDAFIAGFLHGYIQNLPILDCLKTGNIMGALTVLGRGATGDLSGERIKKFVAEYEPDLLKAFK